MRRLQTRLVLRDLAAVCAFLAMAISGVLPSWAVALFGAGGVLALLQIRPFAPNGAASALLLLAGAAGLGLMAYSGALDPVLAACTFAGLLAVNRMLCPGGRSIDHQVLLASLLMMAGAAALTADLLFAVCLAGFVVLAFGALALGVVEEHAEGAPLPTAPLLRRVTAGGLLAVVVGAGLFFAFPRLSWNRFGHRPVSSLGSPITGFSDQVSLSGDGTIKRDLRVVARIQLVPDPGVASLDGYWLGRAFDHFDGQGWIRTDRPTGLTDSVTLGDGGKGLVRQRIELLAAYGSRTLIGLDQPILFGNAFGTSTRGRGRILLERVGPTEVRFASRASGYDYYAYSRPKQPATLSEEARRLDLSLPPGLDPRVAELARKIAGGKPPEQATRLLEAYLRRNYRYTLDLARAGPHPVAEFLFDRKAGHCEHFATALALLLRTLNIPARVASGFYGGERVGEAYVLRGGDAHAWTEAYVDGRWERFDATPPDSREAQASWLADALSRFWEHLDAIWQGQVVDYTLRDQMRALAKVSSPRLTLPKVDLRLGFVLLLLGAGLGLIAQVFKRPRPRSAEATRLLERAERLMAQHALSPRPGEGIEELATRLKDTTHPAAGSVRKLTRRYLEARFGSRPLRPKEPEQLLEGLERALKKTAGAS